MSQPNPVVTCVYCGHQYPDGTPTHQSELLTAHIKQCDKHPMRAVEAELADLKDRLGRIYVFAASFRDRHGAETDNSRALLNLLRGYDQHGRTIQPTD